MKNNGVEVRIITKNKQDKAWLRKMSEEFKKLYDVFVSPNKDARKSIIEIRRNKKIGWLATLYPKGCKIVEVKRKEKDEEHAVARITSEFIMFEIKEQVRGALVVCFSEYINFVFKKDEVGNGVFKDNKEILEKAKSADTKSSGGQGEEK